MRKNIEFQWETEENNAMAIVNEAICNTPALKTLDISDGARHIVVGVDSSLEEWGAIWQKKDKHMIWHPCHYDIGLWN
jgi:hypothetical protein